MRVLLLSVNPLDRTFFAAAAKEAGFAFASLNSPEEVCDELSRDPAALVVIDASTAPQYKAFEDALAEKIGLFSNILNPNYLFFVAPGLSEAPYLASSVLIGHVIRRTFTQADAKTIGPLFKMAAAERAPDGVGSFFGETAKKQTIKITKSLQKVVLVEKLKAHLVEIGFKPRIANVIADVTDELMMNAIFDAAVDDLGKRSRSQIPRNSAIELTGKDEVDLEVAFDGNLLGVSVTDHYGSVDKKKMLSEHIAKSYENRNYEARMISTGAGIGLSYIYRNCGGLIVSCETGERTQVTVLFRRTDSFKEFKDQFRFLSTFVYFS